MVRYEYYIKEARGKSLRPEDSRVILMLSRNMSYPNAFRIHEARELIKSKHVNLSLLGIAFLKGEKGALRYNASCKNDLDCLSQVQYELLKEYYSSMVDDSDRQRGDI